MTTEPGAAPRSRPRWARRLTLATRPAVLAGLLALWLAVTGLPRDASGTLGWLVLLALAVVGVAGGRRLASRPDAPTLLLGAAGALLLLVATSPGVWTGAAAALPTGYGNSNGALLVVVAGLAGWSRPAGRAGAPAVGCLVAAVALAVLSASWFAAAAAVLVAAAALGLRPPATWAAAALAALGVATVAVGVTTQGGTPAGATARATLWAQAVDLVAERPLLGHGPAAFARLAPAGADDDLAWAHSLVLDLTVDAGVFAGLLGLGLVVAVVARLRNPQRSGLIARAAVVGLLAQGLLDHTLQLPLLGAATGLLVGLASGPPE